MNQAVAFCCNECGCDITDFLQAVREEDLTFALATATVPAGHFTRLVRAWSYAEFVTGRDPGQRYRGADANLVAFEVGDFLLNPTDLRFHTMPGAKYGCCGLQPRGEANATCVNGHPIGTLHTDCWAAHIFRLQSSLVTAVKP